MQSPRVLVVAGTHGNEINGPWLLEQWERFPFLLDTCGFDVVPIIGNPAAYARGSRYLDRDLNRSFQPDLLRQAELAQRDASVKVDLEVQRAHDLVSRYGPDGIEACDLVVDLHSTTSAMGNCLVLYGRRPADLALASLLQRRLGLPIYLHENDPAQHGFLAERWPCGLAIEVGPVPQMVRHNVILRQTRLALQEVFAACSEVLAGEARYPKELIIHRYVRNLDYPRTSSGLEPVCFHLDRQGSDWRFLRFGDPIFERADGSCVVYEGEDGLVPIFINEAAYAEKSIALTLTSRECWPLSSEWTEALASILLTR